MAWNHVARLFLVSLLPAWTSIRLHDCASQCRHDVHAPCRLERAVTQLGEPGGGHYVLPPWMGIKFERKGQLAEKQQHEATIAGWIEALQRVEDPLAKRVLSVCVSDGINRKFNVRMMGTGVGRFALEVRKTDLNQFIRKSIQNAQHQLRLFSELKKAYKVSPAPTRVLEGNASDLPLDSNSQGFILTSPPYLPAASGREAYLFSKSIA